MKNLVRVVLFSLFLLFAASVWTADAAPFAYIANYLDDTVSVIDTNSNTVTATVAVGRNPFGVTVNPTGTQVYVTNDRDGTVSVINTSSNTVIATVTVGSSPYGVAVNPNGTRVYVANRLGASISVINTSNNTVIATVTGMGNPIGVAVNPAGTRLYVANYLNPTVSVIDTNSNTVITSVPVGTWPLGIAVNPVGTRVYVTNSQGSSGNTVSVIDTSTSTVTATIPVGIAPEGVAVDPTGTRVYVTNYTSNTVSVIDTGTNTVIATVPVGTIPYGISVNPAGTRVYVANYSSNTVSVIDTSNNSVVATVPVGKGSFSLGQFMVPLISGSCGTSNGTLFTVAPAINLCATGTASAVTGSGPWTWNCTGGTTVSCSAYLQGAPTTAKVFLGMNDNFTVSNSGATVYGSSGADTVTITAGMSGIILDQNNEQINFSGTSGSYKFKQTGNKINVYDSSGMLLVSVPVQGDTDGTLVSFNDGMASAVLAAGVIKLGGVTVSSTAATTLSPATNANTSTPVTATKARVYLGSNDNFTLSNSGASLYGGAGSDIVTVTSGMSEIILDQNVDRINFSEVSSNYTFKQTGNKINVYDVSGTTLLVTVPVQGDVDGTVLAFSNETASARLLNGVMTLGVKTVTSTTSALSPLTTLEIERPAVKAQLNVLTHALQSQDVEKSVQLCAPFSQKKYKTLFASNKAKMVELGKLLNSATLTSIAPDVSINGEQTAELSVEYAGETFHVGLVKFQGSWLFESF